MRQASLTASRNYGSLFLLAQELGTMALRLDRTATKIAAQAVESASTAARRGSQ